MKKLVGVVPLWDDQKQSIWMLPGYLDGVYAAGATPVILPLDVSAEDALDVLLRCDGLLMTGGHDVNPALYEATSEGATKADAIATCETCSRRDALEQALFAQAIEDDKPVLGICRGIQLINVLCGGTLWQDLPTQRPSELEHHGTPPYDRTVHYVDVLEGTPLAATVGAGRLGVNSYHHQAVREVGSELEVMATAEDGLVEAVWRPASRFCWGIQWHPEFSYRVDEPSRRIFSAFVSAL